MTPADKAGTVSVSGKVDAEDTLEDITSKSNGDTDHSYNVMGDGEAIGFLYMKTLVRALVPTNAASDGMRKRAT
ncbi:hypothetical protein [Hoeflea sp.]|uniref:hypothetical protein n=1 Tax=Hoeflea sp. TaxID=1940281 RepID=UPI003749945C